MFTEDGCHPVEFANRLINIDVPSSDKVAAMAHLAYAFSDPLRIQIIAILREEKSVCNCEIQAKLELIQSKASYHLKILVEAGLVTREVRGTWSYYSLINKKTVGRLLKILEDGK